MLLVIPSTFEYSRIIPLQLHNYVNAMGVLSQLIVMIWHSKFGSGVEKERFGLVLAIFLAQPMSMLTLNLETLTVLLSGLYTQMFLQTLIKCGDLFMWTCLHQDLILRFPPMLHGNLTLV